MKPTEMLKWASVSELDPTTNAPNKRKPSAEFELSGLKREQPLFRDHLNWAFDNIGSWLSYLDTVNSTITVNKTIYVATTGSDTTGDGTITTPFATPHKALESLIGTPIATGILVTILCAAGNYNFTTPLSINIPYGERINIVGADLSGTKPYGVPVADWSVSSTTPTVAPRSSNELYNTSGTLSVLASSTTRKAAVADDLSNNKSLLSSRYSTVFNFTNSSGLQVKGNNSLGLFDKILIVGDWDGTETAIQEHNGVECSDLPVFGIRGSTTPTGGSVLLGDSVAVIGFRGNGITSGFASSIVCKAGVVICNNLNTGVVSEAGSGISIENSTIQGNLKHGMLAQSNGFIRANGTIVSGNIVSGLSGTKGGSVRAKASFSYGNGGTGYIGTVGTTLSIDSVVSKGNGNGGMILSSGSSCDSDNTNLSFNNSHGLLVESAIFDGQSATIEGNNSNGIFAHRGGTVTTVLSTIKNNGSYEVSATKVSVVDITASTIPSGSSIFAEKHSYISISNITGVIYSPTYGTVGNIEATINA